MLVDSVPVRDDSALGGDDGAGVQFNRHLGFRIGLEVYVRLDVGGVSHHIKSPPVVTVTSREGRDVKGSVICTSTENWNTN